MRGMAAKPKARPKGPWTAEEIVREERATRARALSDRQKTPEERLEETLRLSRFSASSSMAPPAMFEPDDLLLTLTSAGVESGRLASPLKPSRQPGCAALA